MKHRLLLLALCGFANWSLSLSQGRANDGMLYSPDGNISIGIGYHQNKLTYTVLCGNDILMQDAEIGLSWSQVLSPQSSVPSPSTFTLFRQTKERLNVKEDISAPFYRQRAFTVCYNERTYRVAKGMNIVFRVYNDGIAYRFVKTDKKDLIINNETAHFAFTGNPTIYAAYSTSKEKPYAMAFQNVYTTATLDSMPHNVAFLPVTADCGNCKVTILESDLEAYPGMFVIPQQGSIDATFAAYPKKMDHYRWRGMTYVSEREEYIAKVSGQHNFPWRILCITTEDTQMPVSNLVYALATPNRIGDTSWIKTGKSVWDWWHDWNLKGVPFKAGINMDTYRYYIDFAAEYGIPYVILDEGWYDSAKANIMQPIASLNLQELIDYATKKNVGIVLWTVFNVLDESLDEVCAHYSQMGIKGFKVDFLDRDDQTAVEMAYRIADVCAMYHLVLDYHGFYKPTGFNRTYPNIINVESVFGMEEVKWGSAQTNMPLYDVTFPFIRGMAGIVDFTPGAMRNATRRDFNGVYDMPMSMGTRCHQLAMYVVHDSPFTMLADAATSYQAEPEYTQFLASIPNEVDETRVLQGKLGEYLVVARRVGKEWWVGGMTNWHPRDIELNLDFLNHQPLCKPSAIKLASIAEVQPREEAKPQPSTLTITSCLDGINADHNAEDYRFHTETLTPSSTLRLHMASGGGFVLHIK